ncbi:MAG: DUF1902 domain-containing protein [Gallionella sp.]|nr:DUF1902 domain-containing protein [Gallionella sp.]
MSNIIAFIKPLAVTITHDEGMWVAACDALFLATEAETFEALTARVWELAPDMIEANDLSLDPKSLRFDFQYTQSADDHRLTM